MLSQTKDRISNTKGSAALGQSTKTVRRMRMVACLQLFILLVSILAVPQTARAWKPYTHAKTAQDARNDVVEDGKISVEIKPGVFRDYPVRPEIVAALRDWPTYYNAGVIGPDGY